MIVDLARVLGNTQDPKISLIVLKTLGNLLKISPPREEQLVLVNGLPGLLAVLVLSKKHEEVGLKMLSGLPLASNHTNKTCQLAGVFPLLISYLDEYSNLVENLTYWICTCPRLLTHELSAQLTEKICATPYFQQFLQATNRILRVNTVFAAVLLGSEEFVQKLVREIAIVRDPMALKTTLNTMLLLCRSHSSPREFIESHDIYPLIVSILHTSQDMDLVVVEEIASMLLEVYSHNRNVI